MELRSKIEAILFATEEPISIIEIASILMSDQGEVKKELNHIIRDYKKSEHPMEILITGKKYRMGLKEQYREIAMPVAKKEIGNEEMEAMTLILNSNRVMRGKIREKFGDRSTEILRNLKRMGFVKADKYRNTEIYSLTNKFYKYFGVRKREIANMAKVEEEIEGEDQ